jgi:hypothetical protein
VKPFPANDLGFCKYLEFSFTGKILGVMSISNNDQRCLLGEIRITHMMVIRISTTLKAPSQHFRTVQGGDNVKI